jgi:hypothetical protein
VQTFVLTQLTVPWIATLCILEAGTNGSEENNTSETVTSSFMMTQCQNTEDHRLNTYSHQNLTTIRLIRYEIVIMTIYTIYNYYHKHFRHSILRHFQMEFRYREDLANFVTKADVTLREVKVKLSQ